jgi:hypothetical protein
MKYLFFSIAFLLLFNSQPFCQTVTISGKIANPKDSIITFTATRNGIVRYDYHKQWSEKVNKDGTFEVEIKDFPTPHIKCEYADEFVGQFYITSKENLYLEFDSEKGFESLIIQEGGFKNNIFAQKMNSKFRNRYSSKFDELKENTDKRVFSDTKDYLFSLRNEQLAYFQTLSEELKITEDFKTWEKTQINFESIATLLNYVRWFKLIGTDDHFLEEIDFNDNSVALISENYMNIANEYFLKSYIKEHPNFDFDQFEFIKQKFHGNTKEVLLTQIIINIIEDRNEELIRKKIDLVKQNIKSPYLLSIIDLALTDYEKFKKNHFTL